jgi:hypothetical protein
MSPGRITGFFVMLRAEFVPVPAVVIRFVSFTLKTSLLVYAHSPVNCVAAEESGYDPINDAPIARHYRIASGNGSFRDGPDVNHVFDCAPSAGDVAD